ncbi:lysophospholipid acyltransferase family protein [Fibrobacter sp. UWB11]|uniref:lysophospholipid acyltransferase family protein n=1 Tax=Fibrobacter sp. UWB11 TaxID=1896202 RepID=UPI00092B04DB|nr:lysophospholipid acyltransferase family protein [Fibrobacter sp. UWB11]SIN86444.1 KDO2-lipid IV(A) lauroyltransferase [Fibrobacter sp. UWB11]
MGKMLTVVFARVAYSVLKLAGWKKKTVLANVKHVTGAFPSGALNYDTLLKNLTKHVGELLFCFGTFKKLPHDVSAYPCRVDGWNFSLDESAIPVLEKMRNGGIFLTAHYGNYEAMGPWLCRLGIPLVASYIPVKPKWLNNILERKIRAVDGRSYSVDARTPRDFLRILNEGNLFCLLDDQDSRIPSAIEGTLLGQPVNVNPLPDFLLEHRPQTPIFICWMDEVGASSEKVRVLHAIEVASPAHSSPSVVNVQFNKWLEQRILENPNLWYSFTHRRFYSRSPEIYGE